MSELSARLAALKNHVQTAEIIKLAGVSRETFRKIERGDSVKLKTLHQIAKALKADEEQWIELVIAWLKTEAGPAAAKIWIQSKTPSTLKDARESQSTQALMLFETLNAADRAEVIKTMQRKEVITCIAAINRVIDRIASENR